MTRRAAAWVGVGAALAVLAPAAFWWSRRSASEDASAWVRVRRDDLRIEAEVSGTLKAVDTSALGPPQVTDLWDFKISRMAPEGAEVKAGDPVLGFDTSELERRLEEKRAEADSAQKEIEKRQIDVDIRRRGDDLRLAEAEARLRKARLKVDVPPDLREANDLALRRIELEAAEREIEHLRAKAGSDQLAAAAEVESLRQRRDRARAQVLDLESAIGRMTVPAPRDGTVVYVSNWRNEKKKIGDSCWHGETVLEIPDLTRMEAVGEVDEADAGRIAPDQTVRFRLDAHADTEFTGRVRSIWGTVQRKSWRNPLKVVRFDVVLDATDVRRMRPGMRFTGSVETGRVAAALILPAEAVFPTSDGPVAYRDARVGFERVALRLGVRTAKSVEVIDGLAEGDRVSTRDLSAAGDQG